MKDNYPMMSDLDRKQAPWNREEPTPIKIKVSVSITLSKTVEVEVNDYTATEDMGEDGYPDINYDFSECDLKSAVNDQVVLPNEKVDGWTVDDYEVVMDE